MSGLRRRRPGSASETPALEDASESTGLERPSESETRMVPSEGRTAQVSPFWSERARAEAVLAAARPAGLDEAAERASSARGSDSTELRADTGRTGVGETRAQARAEVDELQQIQLVGPSPLGEPRSFGPGGVVAPLATTEGSGVQAQESHESDVPQVSPEDARLGMRPGERLVVEKTRDLLHDLFDQNQRLIEQQQTLQGRVDKIEDDALNPTMHSASSGGQRDQLDALRSFVDLPVGGWVPPEGYNLGRYVPAKERGSLDFHEGLEEGFRRAMQLQREQAHQAIPTAFVEPPSSPPPPPPRDGRTTPNGTRVPDGTPPRTPTPVFGSPASVQDGIVLQAPPIQPSPVYGGGEGVETGDCDRVGMAIIRGIVLGGSCHLSQSLQKRMLVFWPQIG